MKITHEFSVQQPVEAVWAFFQDVPSVAQCLPGAEVTEDKGDNTYAGTVSVKLGPMRSAFEGEARIAPDEAARSARITGKGVDKRGGSRGQVTVDYALEEAGQATAVTIEADVVLSGPAAQFGRTGLINDISKRLIGEFVDCLEARLGAATPEDAARVSAEAPNAIVLLLRGLWSWLKRLLRRA